MSMTTVTFELPEESLAVIDEIASNMEADRATALREAVKMYLADYASECAALAEGIRQADAGELIDHKDMVARFAAWRSRVTDRAAA